MAISSLVNRVRLPNASQWINSDVRPADSTRRTWSLIEFHNFWLLVNCNIAVFLTGSALIPLGLNWWQAIIAIIVGNIIATIALILASFAGAFYHISFPVYSRAVWGMWGAQFCVVNRIFLSFVWYGFQSWVGGECIYLILLSWDPKYEQHIPNTIPSDTGMTSAQFVAYVIFCIVSLPVLLIQPHKLQRFFYITSAVTMVFFVVLLIWALATMGSAGFGSTIESTSSITTTSGPGSMGWIMVYGIMSTVGSIAAGILNQNDYARLAKRPRDAIWGQVIAFPFWSIFTSIIGILVTAATQERLGGDPVWNPPTLFARLLEKDNSAGTRCAVFFAGLALTVSQIGSNLPGNALSGGIDLACTFPKFINIRRGAFIIAIVSPVVNPWRLVNTATVFLTVLSGYGVFLAPMTGLMVANYLIVSKQKLNIDDLYCGNSNSIYWYWKGINWRAPIAWAVGVAPCLPGFIAAVNTSVSISDGAVELYYCNYLFGFLASALIYSGLHIVWPDRKSQQFIQSSESASELQLKYREQAEVIDGIHLAEERGFESKPVYEESKEDPSRHV